jgi:PAS domain S-box-containing protein
MVSRDVISFVYFGTGYTLVLPQNSFDAGSSLREPAKLAESKKRMKRTGKRVESSARSGNNSDRIDFFSTSSSTSAREIHHRLIEHYAPPSILVDREGEILYVSENARRFLTFGGADRSNNLLRLIDPALSHEMQAALSAARDNGKRVESKNICVELDGDEQFVHITVRPIETPDAYALVMFETRSVESFARTNQETVDGALTFEDITRRVEAENQLRASEERYRNLFNSIDEGFCIVELIFDKKGKPVDYRFLEVSPSFEKQTGMKDPRGKCIREFAPNHEEYWFEIYGRIALTGEPERFEHQAAQLNSWYEGYAFRFGDPQKRQVAILFNNITERKKTEEALRKSEERLRLMSESFTDYAIFMADVDGSVLSWNTGAEKIFGYSQSEIVGRSADILFTPEDRQAGVPEKEMATARKMGRASDERWHMRKDGSRFYASGVMAPLFDQGVLVGYAKIARDLTEAKKLEEELLRYRTQLETLVEERTAELEQTNVSLRQEIIDRQRAEEERIALLRRIVTTQEEERSRIARDMHDQLGQQLTALRLKLATIAEDGSVGPRLAREIEGLQESAARLDSEVGFIAWELRPAALDDLGFVAAIRNFVGEWSRHYQIPAELHAGNVEGRRLTPEVETNLYRITQEALNNINKHAEAKNVNVVIERRKAEILLIIEDDGKGFEPSDNRTTKESGSGLGLVGMRERAAIVGGTLEVESAPGKGTTIFAKVPIKEAK